MSDELKWGDVKQGEAVTEDDIKKAEGTGGMPVGKYLCVVDGSFPKQINPKTKDGEKPKDSYYCANLKHKVESVVELDGKAVKGDEADNLIGKFIWDDVTLEKPDENEHVKNRRISIVKRAGIINKTSSAIPDDCWSHQIIGKRFLLTVEENEYEDKKTGKMKKGKNKVAMFGYETPEEAEKVSEAEIDDI